MQTEPTTTTAERLRSYVTLNSVTWSDYSSLDTFRRAINRKLEYENRVDFKLQDTWQYYYLKGLYHYIDSDSARFNMGYAIRIVKEALGGYLPDDALNSFTTGGLTHIDDIPDDYPVTLPSDTDMVELYEYRSDYRNHILLTYDQIKEHKPGFMKELYAPSLPYGEIIYGEDIDDRITANEDKVLRDMFEGRIPCAETDPYQYYRYYSDLGKVTVEMVMGPPVTNYEIPDSEIQRIKANIIQSNSVSITTPTIRNPWSELGELNNTITNRLENLMLDVAQYPRAVADAVIKREQNRIAEAVRDKYELLKDKVRDESVRFYAEQMAKINDKGNFYFVAGPRASYGTSVDYLISKKPISLESEDGDTYYYGHLVLKIIASKVIDIAFDGGIAPIMYDYNKTPHPHLDCRDINGMCWGNLHTKVVNAVSGKLVDIFDTAGNSTTSHANMTSLLSKLLEGTTINDFDLTAAAKNLKYAAVVNDWFAYTNLIWMLLSEWDDENPYIYMTREEFEENEDLIDNYDYEDFLDQRRVLYGKPFYQRLEDEGVLSKLSKAYESTILSNYRVRSSDED